VKKKNSQKNKKIKIKKYPGTRTRTQGCGALVSWFPSNQHPYLCIPFTSLVLSLIIKTNKSD
jgi:hypothetical protein